MGGAIALELARRRTVRSATALSPAGFWTAAERRYGQASLGALARMPRPLRPALTRLAARPAGRQAVFAQLCAHGSRVPADEARAALRAAWASPVFADALAAFDRYRFEAPEELRGSQ